MKGFARIEKGIYIRKGVYYVCYADENGNPVMKSTKQGSIKAARQILAKRKTDVAMMKEFENRKYGAVKFADLANHWWKHHGEKTRSGWRYLIPKIRDRFGKMKARQITSDQVRAFLDDLSDGLSASSCNHYRTILNSIFNWSLGCTPPLYDQNPVKGIPQFSEPPGRERFLGRAEFQKLLEKCGDDRELRAAVIVLSTTTLRKNELLRRPWIELHLDDPVPYIYVPHSKNGKPKKVQLCEEAVIALKLLPSYEASDKYVFPSRPTTRFTKPMKPWRWDIGKEFRAACEAAEIPDLRIHDLRHMGASILTEAGVPAEVIRKLTGHRSRELDRYQHLSEDTKKRTVDLIAAALFDPIEEK